jgi:hypothetical protein
MMRGDDLYARVKSLEENWLRDHVRKQVADSILPILVRAQNPQSITDVQDQSNERRAAGERFLGVLKEAWEDHQLCMGMITDVLMYMVSGMSLGVLLLRLHGSRLTPAGSDHLRRPHETFHLRRLHGPLPGSCPPGPRSSRLRYHGCTSSRVHSTLHDTAGTLRSYD